MFLLVRKFKMVFLNYSNATNLGNWLFQILAGYGLGRGDVAWFCTSAKGREKLERFRCLYPEMRIFKTLPQGTVRYREPTFEYSPIANLSAEHVLLDGYFQSPHYFPKNAREYLTCPEKIRQQLDADYGAIFANGTVGISVRRGDYLRLPHRHPFVGTRYLTQAVKRFDPSSVYLVCSDDIAWCKRFFSEGRFPGRKFVFVEGKSVLAQLYAQAFCTHNIIGNSTFSWWGAWLNSNPNKRVIFPSLWFGFAIKSNPRELYFEGCEIVKNHYTLRLFVHALWMIGRTYCGGILRRIGLRK